MQVSVEGGGEEDERKVLLERCRPVLWRVLEHP